MYRTIKLSNMERQSLINIGNLSHMPNNNDEADKPLSDCVEHQNLLDQC